MARKSSDPTPTPDSRVSSSDRRDAPVFVVAPKDDFLSRVRAEFSDLPDNAPRHRSIPDLIEALSQFDRISLAFVVVAQSTGADIDVQALRDLRLDFPQIVIVAILGECEQRDALRLQSIGVHSILLPPFAEVSLSNELATAMPNVSRFKRNADLMRRAQARMDFLIPSDLSYVLGVNHEISTLLREFGFPVAEVRVNIPLACDEAVTNAILHGNGGNPEKKVNIQIYVSHSRFRIRVRDQGDGFDVSTVEDPREGENVMRSGGRGVFLMRKIMDTVVYKEDGRVLELEKRNTGAESNGAATNDS